MAEAAPAGAAGEEEEEEEEEGALLDADVPAAAAAAASSGSGDAAAAPGAAGGDTAESAEVHPQSSTARLVLSAPQCDVKGSTSVSVGGRRHWTGNGAALVRVGPWICNGSKAVAKRPTGTRAAQLCLSRGRRPVDELCTRPAHACSFRGRRADDVAPRDVLYSFTFSSSYVIRDPLWSQRRPHRLRAGAETLNLKHSTRRRWSPWRCSWWWVLPIAAC